MRHVSEVDIAPTIARVLGITIPQIDGKPIKECGGLECKNFVLIIVNSLGYDLDFSLEPDLKTIPALAISGLLIRAEAVSTHTSHSIASILSECHRIFDKEGDKKSSMQSIPNVASSKGLRSAVVMEKNGQKYIRQDRDHCRYS